MSENKDLKSLSLAELEKLVQGLGEKKFIAKVIFNWIQEKNCSDINNFTNVSKEFRNKLLAEGYFISELKIVKKQTDEDGTNKYLFELTDGNKIETVLLLDEERKTICLSSQVGCKFDCAFCATGKIKYNRDLTASEIIDQVTQIEKENGKINNLVYMGMGEPLDNYEEVLKSIYILNDPAGKNIGARHITISTCGIIPGIQRLSQEPLQLRLAVSLHGHTDNIRSKIMKVNARYPVEELIAALREYQKITKRRITFEYLMLAGVNDSRAEARGLLKLINGIKAHVNLIEFNEFSGCEFKPSPHKDMKDFQWIIADRGFEVTIRYKRGRQIKAACGQLQGEN